jgi:hypothetical protein
MEPKNRRMGGSFVVVGGKGTNFRNHLGQCLLSRCDEVT